MSDSATAEPRLRDEFGQDWAWPPLLSPEDEATGLRAPRGVWLVFLPGAFTPVCSLELKWVDDLARECVAERVDVRVIAPDSAPVLRTVAEQLQISTPLLSDFWPHGAAAQQLGCFDSTSGRPHRTSVLLDRDGIERARVVGDAGTPRTVVQHVEAMASAKLPNVG